LSSKGDAKSIQGGGELSGLLRHAEALQRDLDKALAELKNEVVEAHDAARLASVKLGGDGSVREVRLNVAGLDPKQKVALEEALAVALKLVIERMFELRQKRAATVTKGMTLPGLFS
jgi:DNA-binding protein YbaB